MSIITAVIDRFVDYYSALNNQPHSAMTALYHPDAQLIDPFGSHPGLFAIRVTSPSAGQYLALPLCHGCAPVRRESLCGDLDHALVASEDGRGRNAGPAGLLSGDGAG